jgi:hypothetical protein
MDLSRGSTKPEMLA